MKAERVRYPDGQISAKIIDYSGEVKQRINSYEDLMYVRSIAEAINFGGNSGDPFKDKSLFIPCLFGQRSDRRFAANQSFDLKIIAEVINSCNFSRVTIFDPHSDVALALINHSEKMSSYRCVANIWSELRSKGEDKNLVLVSPDAGAYKKVFEYAESLKLPIVAAVKHRDLSGKVNLQFIGDVKGKKCLIVDDLCSRGNTFIQLATKLRAQGAEKIFLYVSHFEGGCEEYKQTIQNLRKVIDGIYTTNSFRNFDEEDKEEMTIYMVI